MNIVTSGINIFTNIKNTQKIYKLFKSKNRNIYMDFTTRKERSDMILEPLQVMTQLALLSHSPIGTKVSVSDNILQLHPPSFFQGAWRWYNSDGKDDLYYLFHAIRRYYKWYKTEDNRIFAYVLESAIKGLEHLIVTYSKSQQTAITHTLALYKNVLSLESPDLFKDTSEDAISIDTVFETIKETYDKKLLKIIYNTLLILDDDSTTEDIKKYYIDGLLSILNPTNDNIRKWIREKLTC
tara:strand:- start:62 stop:778 length:717 start_codon:yes stop_codon:yes gene_type:complete